MLTHSVIPFVLTFKSCKTPMSHSLIAAVYTKWNTKNDKNIKILFFLWKFRIINRGRRIERINSVHCYWSGSGCVGVNRFGWCMVLVSSSKSTKRWFKQNFSEKRERAQHRPGSNSVQSSRFTAISKCIRIFTTKTTITATNRCQHFWHHLHRERYWDVPIRRKNIRCGQSD